LVNNHVMLSYNGEIIEALFENGTGISINVHDGGLELTNQGLLHLSLSAPSDLLGVAGSPTAGNTGSLVLSKQPVAAGAVYMGPLAPSMPADPTFRALEESDLPPIHAENLEGTLAVSHGGTGTNATLVGNRIMVSDGTSQSIVESPALTDGYVLIGATGGPPLPAPLGAGSGIAVVLGANAITIAATGTCAVNETFSPSCVDISGESCSVPLMSNCIPQALSLVALDVMGATTLGTQTTCDAPLSSGCYNLTGNTCPDGPMSTGCIPTSGLMLQDLFVQNLVVVNSTSQHEFVQNATFISTQALEVTQSFDLAAPMSCNTNYSISSGCFDISNKECPNGRLHDSCFPTSYIFENTTVTNTLNVNHVVCWADPLPAPCIDISGETCSAPVDNSCLPLRVATINGIAPNTGTFDFAVNAGTGKTKRIISISPTRASRGLGMVLTPRFNRKTEPPETFRASRRFVGACADEYLDWPREYLGVLWGLGVFCCCFSLVSFV
jgi:hypothetical protein